MVAKNFIRTGHGAGAGEPRIEISPPDELSKPVPEDAHDDSGSNRGQNGRFGPGNTVSRKGGKAKAHRVRLARSIGLAGLEERSEFQPYRKAAAAFRSHHSRELAAMAGGECGMGPSSMIASAALQLAASRYLFDLGANTCDPAVLKQASQLANDSRQNLLAAYELAVRQAQARPKRSAIDHIAELAGEHCDEWDIRQKAGE